ncbi:type II restriction endonuclease [Aromatoleum petrolei]|uniref:Type II restriction endonuclease n=1 Tax=Aromatoleum petrolei TaxID=76116 RepID=A0ABX1MPK7_9RHOO|nr:type II restriction endonuclease [Aromatoleum petrolei]NMF89882.1 type II restriction endonuclease [Aromatoleum petrolei]QTQ34483.1 Putative type II restriction enzyme [Aromatoleum petrolei]
MQHDALLRLIDHWKSDPHSTYNTWFLWDERLKNFRSIRRGIAQVVREIEAGTFGNAYRGSSLETVVGSVAEQRQIFKGADHAFLWKPKLRIPDIYENEDNQRAFARLLHTCDCCDSAEAILEAIRRIDALCIKGLGPAVANLLYFIHPTLVTPFNTAIVNGFNALTGSKVKLGRWDHYLSLRDGLIRLNEQHRSRLSNDLGAIAGLMFDVGSGRYTAPPTSPDHAMLRAWEADLQRVREETTAAQRQWLQEREGDTTHTEIQGWLRELGLALGYQVWIAANDRTRPFGGGRLADGCLETLPEGLAGGLDSVRLIDVLWISREEPRVAAAFEVEHSTSIYSGIVRMLDLALGTELASRSPLFLVAPDNRRHEVQQQLRRPAFSRVTELGIRYLPYSELKNHRETIARFGSGIKPVMEISQAL